MPRHKKGTIVFARLKADVVTLSMVNALHEVTQAHGFIYIVEKFLPTSHHENIEGQDAYACKSVATGKYVQLYPYEITTRGRGAD